MYASFRSIFHRIPRVVVVGLFLFSALVSYADVFLGAKNDGTGTYGYRIEYYNGSVWTSFTSGILGAGGSSSLAQLSLPAGYSLRTEFWTNSAGTIGTGTLATERTARTTTVTPASNSGTYWFDRLGTPPTYRLDVTLRNNTFGSHTYTISSNGVVIVSAFTLSPGGTATVTYTNQSALWPVSLQSTDSGAVPAFSYSIPATPGSFWRMEDGSTPTATEVQHTYTSVTPGTNSVDFNAFSTNVFPNTNNLTEGTFKSGTIAEVAAQRDAVAAIQALGTTGASQLQSLTNVEELLRNIKTNTSNGAQHVADGSQVDTNASSYQSEGVSKYASISNSLVSLQSDASSISNVTITATVDDDFWVVNVPHFGPVDFNPMHQGPAATVANWVRGLLAWIAYAGLLMFMLRDMKDAYFRMGAFQQGHAPVVGFSIATFGAQSSLLMHLPIFFVVAAALIGFMSGMVTFISTTGSVSALSSSPFNPGNTAVLQGLWLVTQFVPVTLLIVHFVTALVWHLMLALGAAAVQIIIRSLPGCIIWGLIVANCYGDIEFKVHNATVNTINFGDTNGQYYIVPPGTVFSSPPWSGPFWCWDTNAVLRSGSTSDSDFPSGRDGVGEIWLGGSGSYLQGGDNEFYTFDRGMYVGSALFLIMGVKWLLAFIGRGSGTGAPE